MNKNNLAQVFHFDLYGKRENKYTFLKENSLKNIKWNDLNYSAPNYFFVKKDFIGSNEYELGFKVDLIFKLTSNGVEVGRESVSQFFSEFELTNIDSDIINLSSKEFQSKYNLIDSRDWVFEKYKNDLLKNNKEIIQMQVKPFDFRYTHFTGKSRGFHTYPAITVNKNI
ncbi:MAG: hypothetical protein NTW25_02040 [Candidatus Kapabacteria bacterium]|nr:hypothetical protein [Candidatus Kapabacteria bacterium]